MLTVEDVADAICALPDKQCSSDPIATRYVKEAVGVLVPFFTELFNRSLITGSVPSSFEAEYVTPFLKKVSLDPADVSSYRPISNLPVMSKLLERLVAKQLVGNLTASGLLPKLQSAFCAHHRRKPQFWGSWLSSCGRSIPVTWRSWRCSTYEPRSIPWITQLCCVGWAWCTLDCAVLGWSYAVRPLRLLWVGSSDFVIRYPAGLGPWADSVPAVYRQPMEAHRRAWPHSSSVCCLHTDLRQIISIWCPAAAGEGFEMP